MSYPTVYDVTYSYSGFQQAQGDNSFPGTQLDADLIGLHDSVSALALFTQGVMRSDGRLNNGVVTYDSLAAELQTAGLAPATAWSTPTSYLLGNAVTINSNLYRCLIAHTSGVFATDLAAGKWIFVAALITGPTGPQGPQGSVSDYDTRALAVAATIAAPINYLRLAGFSAAGDGGAALYSRVTSLATNAYGFQSADGAWWQYADRELNVKAFGAVFDGVADDTAAWQACIDMATGTVIAGIPSGSTISVPPGITLVGKLTGNGGALKIRCDGYTVMYAGAQSGTPAPVLDLTGCDAVSITGLTIYATDTAGNQPTVTPTVGILLAHFGTDSSNVNEFENTTLAGYFQYASLYVNGSTNNVWRFCRFGNLYTEGYAVGLTTTNILAVPGAGAGPYVTADEQFFACEFHARHVDATGNRPTIIIDGCDDIGFYGCLFDQSSGVNPTIQFYGTPSQRVTFMGGKAYKEFGAGGYTYFLDATGAAASQVRVINLSLNPGPINGNYTGTFTDLSFNVPEGRSTIGLGAKASLSAGATVYFGIGASSASDDVFYVVPEAGVLSTLRYQGGGSPGAGQTFTHTLRKNGADTALTCSNTAAATTASDTSHTVAVAAGDYISIKSVASAGAGSSGSNFFGVSFTPTG